MALAIALAGIATPAAFAAKPVTVPMEPSETPFGQDTVCHDAVTVKDIDLHGTETTYSLGRSGLTLIHSVGTTTTRVTNERTQATYSFSGRFAISILIFADGSARAVGIGPGVWAWYLNGDPSELGTGIFQIKAHATEKYDVDGNLVSATASGPTVNLCAKVGSGPAMP